MGSDFQKPDPIRCGELWVPFAMWPLLILIGSVPIVVISLFGDTQGIGEMFRAEPFFMSIALVIFILCLVPGFFGIRLLKSHFEEMKIFWVKIKRADSAKGTFTLHLEFYPQTSLDYSARTTVLGVSDESGLRLPEHHYEIIAAPLRKTRGTYDLTVTGALHTFEGKPIVLVFPEGRIWFAQFHKHSSI